MDGGQLAVEMDRGQLAAEVEAQVLPMEEMDVDGEQLEEEEEAKTREDSDDTESEQVSKHIGSFFFTLGAMNLAKRGEMKTRSITCSLNATVCVISHRRPRGGRCDARGGCKMSKQEAHWRAGVAAGTWTKEQLEDKLKKRREKEERLQNEHDEADDDAPCAGCSVCFDRDQLTALGNEVSGWGILHLKNFMPPPHPRMQMSYITTCPTCTLMIHFLCFVWSVFYCLSFTEATLCRVFGR